MPYIQESRWSIPDLSCYHRNVQIHWRTTNSLQRNFAYAYETTMGNWRLNHTWHLKNNLRSIICY